MHMKLASTTIAGVVLLVALFGAARSFVMPAEKIVKQSVKLVNYEQTGEFGYRAFSRPTSLYGGAAAALAPDPIPVSVVEDCEMSFTYSSNVTPTGPVKVEAVLENPGMWKKSVALTVTARNDDAVSFPLDLKGLQAITDAINKEIGTPASSLQLTLRAVVPGGARGLDGGAVDYVQTLPVKVTRSFLTFGDGLDYRQGGSSGRFDYRVKLGENTLYGPVTISSPPSPTEAGVLLGPGDTVFTRLIQSMDVTFAFRMTADRPLRKVSSDFKLEAVVSSPDRWSKTYTLVPSTTKDGDFTVSLPLDLAQFAAVFDTIQQETGLAASSESLSLQATVHSVAMTEQGTIDRTFTHSIKTDLRSGVLAWEGDLKKSVAGSVDSTAFVSQPARLFGLPVSDVRTGSIVLGVLAVLVLGISLRSFISHKGSAEARIARQAADIERKYRAMLVEVKTLPQAGFGEMVMPVDTIEDLVKVGQSLLKPVHHAVEEGNHVYWVYDDHKRYDFYLTKPVAAKPARSAADSI